MDLAVEELNGHTRMPWANSLTLSEYRLPQGSQPTIYVLGVSKN